MVGVDGGVIEMSIRTNQKQQTEWRPPLLLLAMPQGRVKPPPTPALKRDCFGTFCCYGNVEMRPSLALNKPPLLSIAINIAK